MAQEFHLGFSIDTTGLRQAAQEATKAADQIGRLGDAEGKAAQSSGQAAAAQKKVAEATKEAGGAAERYLQFLKLEEQATKQYKTAQDALNKALHDGKLNSQQHVRYTKEVEDSYNRAKRAAQDFRSATMGANAGERMGAALQALSGHVNGAQSGLAGLQGMLSGGGGLTGALDGAGGLLTRFGAVMTGTTLAVAGATVGVGLLAAGYTAAMFALAPYEDKLQQLEARLSNSLGSMTAAKSAMEALRVQTQETGLGFDAAADAFGRIARNNEAIGLTQQQMLDMVETVQKLGAASGASMGEMSSGMIQFGQALASGRLQGDELRSIMENFPALAKAIAQNFETADGRMGVTIGTLRRMGSEGELTGRKIADAVLRAQEQAREEYEKLPFTMERANQRVSDSFSLMLANMGKAFGSSAFVQGIYDFLNTVAVKVSNIFASIAKSNQEADIKNLKTEIATGRSTPSEALMVGRGYDNSRKLTPKEIAERRTELAKLEGERALTPEQQKEKDEKLRLGASVSASDTLIGANLGARGQQRKKDSDTRQLTATIADIDKLIAMGGSEGMSLADLKAQRADAAAALKNVGDRKIGGGPKTSGAPKGPSAYDRMLQDIEDMTTALASGGGGGGTAIYSEALQARRGDAQDKRAKELSSYVSALTSKAVQATNQATTALERQTAKQEAFTGTIGKSRQEIRELEIAQQAADYRFEKFGTVTTPAVEAAMDSYTKALRANTEAADRNALAQKAQEVSMANARTTALLAAKSDPRSQARAALEFDLAEERKKVGNTPKEQADFDKYAQDRRRSVSLDDMGSERAANEALVRREATMRKTLQLSTLQSGEYEVQMELAQKAASLQAQGYREEEGFYRQQMRETERLARLQQQTDRVVNRNRAIIGSFDEAAKELEPLFKNTFDAIFEDGVGSAANVFAKGFGNIIKDLGKQMIYELAFKPLQELLAGLARAAAQKLVTSIFGASPGPAAANGAWFDGGVSNFAKGGAFTNSVVNHPTMFAFAGGIGMMGEAGPEAIMPLKRDGMGRLGVISGGSNDNGSTVVINDMRTSAGAERVETKEQRGPDGRRMLSIMVRDEVRGQIRAGGLDREMVNNFGTNRVLARK